MNCCNAYCFDAVVRDSGAAAPAVVQGLLPTTLSECLQMPAAALVTAPMSSSAEPPALSGLHRWCRSLERRRKIFSVLGTCLQAPAAAPVAAPMSSSTEPPTLSQPIKVSRPNLALGNYPPGPDDVASKSVSGPDTSQGPASDPHTWALVDNFRHGFSGTSSH